MPYEIVPDTAVVTWTVPGRLSSATAFADGVSSGPTRITYVPAPDRAVEMRIGYVNCGLTPVIVTVTDPAPDAITTIRFNLGPGEITTGVLMVAVLPTAAMIPRPGAVTVQASRVKAEGDTTSGSSGQTSRFRGQRRSRIRGVSTCSDCRWWDTDLPNSELVWAHKLRENRWGACQRTEQPSSLALPDAADNIDLAFLTAPTFGCIQWETK